MKEKIIGHLLYLFIRVYFSTIRYRVQFEDEADKKFFFEDLYNFEHGKSDASIYAFFHQDEIALIPYFCEKDITVMVSQSKDGEIMTEFLRPNRISTVRGSSSRGAVGAFLAIYKRLSEGRKIAMAVDGPRGPIYKVKDGVIKLHEKSRHPIVPLKAYPGRFYLFHKAWNQARLPYPFSKIKLIVGKIGSYTNEELERKLINL